MEPHGGSLAHVGYTGKSEKPATFSNPRSAFTGDEVACSLGALGAGAVMITTITFLTILTLWASTMAATIYVERY
jgi:hypothetical protein